MLTNSTTQTVAVEHTHTFNHIQAPSGQSTPPPSNKGSLPAALCRELVSRTGIDQDGLVGSGSQPASLPYDCHPTAARGDTLCWGPWWVRNELKKEDLSF